MKSLVLTVSPAQSVTGLTAVRRWLMSFTSVQVGAGQYLVDVPQIGSILFTDCGLKLEIQLAADDAIAANLAKAWLNYQLSGFEMRRLPVSVEWQRVPTLVEPLTT